MEIGETEFLVSGNRLLCRSPGTVFETPLDEVSYVKGVEKGSAAPLFVGAFAFLVGVAFFTVEASSPGWLFPSVSAPLARTTGYGWVLSVGILGFGVLVLAASVLYYWRGNERYVEVGGGDGVLARVEVSEELEDSGFYGLLSVMENRPRLEERERSIKVNPTLELGGVLEELQRLGGPVAEASPELEGSESGGEGVESGEDGKVVEQGGEGEVEDRDGGEIEEEDSGDDSGDGNEPEEEE